jgi:hypothetical protein
VNSFPTSLVLLLVFGFVAVGLVVFYGGRRILFQRNAKRGKAALALNQHIAAFQFLCKAERLWDYNPNKHSMKSHRKDLEDLKSVVDGIESSAAAAGIQLDVEEYRKAVDALQHEFSATDNRLRSEMAKSYVIAFSQLKAAQASFRRRLNSVQVGTV